MTRWVGLDGGVSSTSLSGIVFLLIYLRITDELILPVVVEGEITTLLAVGIAIDVVGVK